LHETRRLVSRSARISVTTVIAFPRERCRASSGKTGGKTSGKMNGKTSGPGCTVIILPVVRIERWPAKPTRKRNPRKRKTP
jgi:hypothetical protein